MSAELIARRTVLKGLNLSAAGLALGFFDAKASGASAAKPDGLQPNVFVHVSPVGLVSIWCARSEMGQGVRSSIPVLIADELGAEPGQVRVLQADGDEKYGDQNTDGSHSIRGSYDQLRQSGAVVRTMLVGAAAKKWGVSPDLLTAQNNFVFQKGTQRKLGFGALAVAAAAQPVPSAAKVKLRPQEELTHVGTDLPLVDAPAYASGTAVFAADVRLPGMLTAVIARPPAVGGTLKRYDASKALAVPGVRKVLEMPVPKAPWHFQPWGGLAVIADTTWAAMKGRAALELEWEAGPNGSYDSDAFAVQLSKTVHEPGTPVRRVGDATAALAAAARQVEGEYHVPHLIHAPMEPPCAVAHVKGGKAELWVCSQDPQTARKEAAKTLGMKVDDVTVHVTFLGGGFGRKSKADFVNEAAFIAQQLDVPVRLQWSREDDIQHGYYNACSTQLLTAGLDPHNTVTAWRHRVALTPIGSIFNGATKATAGDLQQGVLDLALSVPNVLAEACEAPAKVRVGWLRSVYNIFTAFAQCSFMDELAHARGLDPRENLLELIGPPRKVSLSELGIDKLQNYGQPLDEHPVDAARLRNVIERVTERSDWANRKKNGRTLGLAAHRSFLSYAAVVASVVKGPNGRPAVDEIWVSFDPGLVVNTDRVRSQLEGAMIFGMSIAYYGEGTMKGGATQQSNFHDYRIVRMNEAPRAIHADIVMSKEPSSGVGEPGVPPVAPAIANAIFALNGKRIRELPFSKQR